MQQQLVAEQRTVQRGLAVSLNRHLIATRGLLDSQHIAATVPKWSESTGALIHSYAQTSAVLAGRFYLAERSAAGVAGRFTVPFAPPPSQDQVKASLSYAASSLYGNPEPAVFDSVLAGVAQRLVVNAGRQTVLRSIQADRRAQGWSRETEGDACPFCLLLAGRGAVYRSETTADFQAHDHCECLAVPNF